MTNLLDTIETSLVPRHVGIEEFVESDQFCNKALYPAQKTFLKLIFLEELSGEEEDTLDYWIAGGRNGTEIQISPDIRERVDFLRADGYKHFREVGLVGGRRSSKGWMTAAATGKVMYETVQLGDPGEHYGIDPDREIYFSCVAGSEAQAKEFQYADLVSIVESCKAMERFRVFPTLETEIRISTEADLRKIDIVQARQGKVTRAIARLRGKALAANAGTLRGSATMVCVIDEMAHMIPGQSKASASEVYQAADPSLDQFGVDGMMFCNSSPYTKVGAFYDRYVAMMRPFDPTKPISFSKDMGEGDDPSEGNGNPRLMAFMYPSWALFENYKRYKSKWMPKHKFDYVITASPDWDENELDAKGEPVYSDEDIRRIFQARAKEAENPESYRVERRGKFAEVVDAFLIPRMVDQMFEGKPTHYETNAEGMPIIRRQLYSSDLAGEGALNVFRYKIHVDPSSTTAGFGFALGHLETFTQWDGVSEEHVVFDLIKSWNPKDFPGSVIRWAPILRELETFADIYRPFEITFDQHESVDPIQDLSERLQMRNIATRVYMKTATNELNWKRWEVFRTALYQGLVHAPYDAREQKPFGVDQELKFLQQQNTGSKYPRVDKQDIGPVQLKDRADCVAEVTYTLIGNLMVNRMRDRLANSSLIGGAAGGYPIGGSHSPPVSGVGPVNIHDFYRSREQTEANRAMRYGSAVGRARGNWAGRRRSR